MQIDGLKNIHTFVGFVVFINLLVPFRKFFSFFVSVCGFRGIALVICNILYLNSSCFGSGICDARFVIGKISII